MGRSRRKQGASCCQRGLHNTHTYSTMLLTLADAAVGVGGLVAVGRWGGQRRSGGCQRPPQIMSSAELNCTQTHVPRIAQPCNMYASTQAHRPGRCETSDNTAEPHSV